MGDSTVYPGNSESTEITVSETETNDSVAIIVSTEDIKDDMAATMYNIEDIVATDNDQIDVTSDKSENRKSSVEIEMEQYLLSELDKPKDPYISTATNDVSESVLLKNDGPIVIKLTTEYQESDKTDENEPIAENEPPSMKPESTPLSEDLKKLESRLEKYIPKGGSTNDHQICNKNEMTQSVVMRLHSGQTASSRAKTENRNSGGKSSTSPTEKSPGTASMLKTTLRKMTRFSMGGKDSNKKERSDPNMKDQAKKSPPSDDQRKSRSQIPNPSRLKKPGSSSPNILVSRSKSFKEPERPGIYRQNSGHRETGQNMRNNVYSSSLRRTKKKDAPVEVDQVAGGHLPRSGTGGHLERGSNRRSASASRGSRIVKKSRPVQTSLTVDPGQEEWREGLENVPATQIQFQVWLPELIGGDTDTVETQVCESNEPVDVRKNRQLTLDNMKLSREVERIKAQTTENELLKKELKNVRAKLEEEQNTRTKIQADLDANHERVRLIMESMDSVERQFESREVTVGQLETDLRGAQDLVSYLQQDINKAEQTIAGQKNELDRSVAAQKMLLQQLQETEAEARELQDFLQMEKATLGEALRESEAEGKRLRAEMDERGVTVKQLEEQAGHLVRRSEVRNQELQAARADLSGMKERAREMLLAQGAELSRACVAISQLVSRLEHLLSDVPQLEVVDMESGDEISDKSEFSESVSDGVAVAPLPDIATKRRSSQFLVTPTDPVLDICSEFSRAMMSTSTGSDSLLNGADHTRPNNSDSLTTLATAIVDRKNSEDGANRTGALLTVPTLADQINQADALLVRYILINTNNLNKSKSTERNHLVANGSTTQGNINETMEKIGSSATYNYDAVQSLDFEDSELARKATEAQHNVISDLRKQLSSRESDLAKRESDLAEVRSKFAKNRQILTSNWEQAESEVKRLDDIYHDTVDQVLQALRSVPGVVGSNPTLNQLLLNLELAASEEEEGGQAGHLLNGMGMSQSGPLISSSDLNASSDIMSSSHSGISSLPALLTPSATQISLTREDTMNANQSL